MPTTPQPVTVPNLGLYLGRPSFQIPLRGLEDCLNVRVKQGSLTSFLMGWEPFTAQNLGGPVTLIDTFFRTDGTLIEIAGTLTDLFEFDSVNNKWLFLTPRHETGTASASGTAVTGVGTTWNTGDVKVRAGDEISFGATGRRNPNDLWYKIATVNSDTSLTLATSAGTVGSGAYTIRQKFQSANLKNYWRTAIVPRGDVGAVIVDRWYATNGGVDFIVRLAQGDTQVTRIHTAAAGGFKCVDLRRFKNMLLYLNIIENSGSTPNKPQSLKNSDVGKPETMTGGLAGEFVAGPQTAKILTSQTIGDDLAIYTENEIVNTTFVGSPDIFAFRSAIVGTGLIAGRLVAQFTETHQFMGRDALYDYNGIQAAATDSHVWFQNLREQDQNRIEHSYTIFDEENGQLMWAMAKVSDIGPTTPTNLLLYSEYLDAATWVKTNATITANNANDPLTGLPSADKLLEDATAAVEHGVHQAVTKAASALTYTYSAYCDPDTRTRVRLRIGDDTDTDAAFADFNLATDTITTGAAGSGYAVVGTSISTVGTYKRVAVTISTPSADTTIRCAVRLLDGAGAVSYNGDGASGMWVWGTQLEQSSALGPYIRASVAQVVAPTEAGPDLVYEAAYLEDLPPGTPTPYTRRSLPMTAAGFFTRDTTLTWASLTQPWTAFNFAWGDRILAAAFPLILFGDIVGRVYKINTSDNADGKPLPSFALFGRRFIGDYRHRNLVHRVYPLTRELAGATYKMMVTTSTYDKADGTGTNQIDEFGLTPTNLHFVSPRIRGRVAQVQFGTPGAAAGGQPWRLDGYDWTIFPGGER